MRDIDRLSRSVPSVCKLAPMTQNYHIEDCHRAGGIMGILGELDRAGLLHRDCSTVHGLTIGETLDAYDIMRDPSDEVEHLYKAAPGGVRTTQAFSQANRFKELDKDRETGCIRSKDHAYSQDGGLAVLFGNIAQDGCIVKTAGVDESILTFKGPARIFESQESAVKGITTKGFIKPGDVVIIRYEGPRGGPGMQEMLYPTSYLKAMGLGKDCALITDGRFSGGTSGLSIGHASPEAASGGAIALIEEGDLVEIDIPNRTINVAVAEDVLASRRDAMNARGENAWQPEEVRPRNVTTALKAYALLATSADKGAVRDLTGLKRVAD